METGFEYVCDFNADKLFRKTQITAKNLPKMTRVVVVDWCDLNNRQAGDFPRKIPFFISKRRHLFDSTQLSCPKIKKGNPNQRKQCGLVALLSIKAYIPFLISNCWMKCHE